MKTNAQTQPINRIPQHRRAMLTLGKSPVLFENRTPSRTNRLCSSFGFVGRAILPAAGFQPALAA
jgi:hypothetical protein